MESQDILKVATVVTTTAPQDCTDFEGSCTQRHVRKDTSNIGHASELDRTWAHTTQTATQQDQQIQPCLGNKNNDEEGIHCEEEAIELKSSFAYASDSCDPDLDSPYFSCSSKGGCEEEEADVESSLHTANALLKASFAFADVCTQGDWDDRVDEFDGLEQSGESDEYHSLSNSPTASRASGVSGGENVENDGYGDLEGSGSKDNFSDTSRASTAMESAESEASAEKDTDDHAYEVGMWWMVHNDKMVVAGFEACCPGRDQGIRPGDILRAVDGVDVLRMKLRDDGIHEAEELLLGEMSSSCMLSLMRAHSGDGTVSFQEYTAVLSRERQAKRKKIKTGIIKGSVLPENRTGQFTHAHKNVKTRIPLSNTLHMDALRDQLFWS